MLALTLREGLSVKIGPDITVQLVRVYGRDRRIRIGITAPQGVDIVREDAILREPKICEDCGEGRVLPGCVRNFSPPEWAGRLQ